MDNHPLIKRYNKDTYVNQQAYEKLLNAKVFLMARLPFWGVIACDLVLVEEPSILGRYLFKTLATDGNHIIYNAVFINSLSDGEVVFAVAHEISHCLMAHVGKHNRLSGRNPKIFNKAADYCINQELRECEIGEFITKIKILYDKKFNKMFTEQVYDILMKYPEDDTDTLDTHINITSSDASNDDSEAITVGDTTVVINSDGSITIKKPKKDIEKNHDDMDSLIRRAVDTHYEAEQKGYIKNNKSAGSIPGEVLRYYETMNQPTIDWKVALRKFTTYFNKAGYSYSKPNKALFNAGFTLPGFRTRSKYLEIAIAFDTSGSVSTKFIEAFLSEFMGILKSVGAFKIHVWCFDGVVHDVSYHVLTKHSNNNVLDIVKPFLKNVVGGGGTNFISNWEFMKTHNILPKAFLLLSDGYPFGKYGVPDYCPTLFLFGVDSGTEKDEYPPPASFGKTLYVEIDND